MSPLYFSFVRISVTVFLLHFALPLGDGILKPSRYLQIPALVLICKSTEQRRLLPPLLPDAPFTLFITVKMLICQMCLTVSKTLKLTPCDVFGNAPVFLLRKRGHMVISSSPLACLISSVFALLTASELLSVRIILLRSTEKWSVYLQCTIYVRGYIHEPTNRFLFPITIWSF